MILLTSWGGAQYIDRWFFVHLLGGFVLALVLRFYSISLRRALIMSGLILIGWEIYEKAFNIAEPWINTFIDIIIGYLGVFFAYKIPLFYSKYLKVLFLVFNLFLFIGLSLWGWISWKQQEDILSIIMKSENNIYIYYLI